MILILKTNSYLLPSISVTEACRTQRSFREPSLGISSSQVAQFVNMRYYVDKELMVRYYVDKELMVGPRSVCLHEILRG